MFKCNNNNKEDKDFNLKKSKSESQITIHKIEKEMVHDTTVESFTREFD